MKKSEIKNCNGFSYIELLITVGIIIILVTGLVVIFNPAHRMAQARDSQRELHLNSIWHAIEERKLDKGGWNCGAVLPTDTFREIGVGPGMIDLYSCLYPKHLSNALVDPKEGVEMTGRNITDGLVGHWTFDEGSGDIAYDYSGNDNHGALVNDPDWVDGKIGKALEFDGTNQYVNAGNDTSLDITKEITVVGWINIKSYGWPNHIVHKYTAWDVGSWYLSLSSNEPYNKLRFLFIDKDLGYIGRESTQVIPLNEWTHVAVTYDGTMNLYINGEGEVVYTNGKYLISAPNQPLNINRLNDALDGLIDDVRIYDRALSAEEIKDLYNYEYETKYSIWQNAQTGDVSLRALNSETKEVSTTNPGGALLFDGVNELVNCGNDATLNFETNGRFSISLWLNPNTLVSAWRRGIIRMENYLISGYLLGIDNGGRPVFWTSQSGGNLSLHAPVGSELVVDAWNHLVITYENQQGYMYLDGEQIVSATGTYMAGMNTMRIGHIVNEYFSGLINDVRIYDRALSEEEVKKLYYGNHITDGLVGYWLLSEMEGCTAYDYSGNDNHGTLEPNCETGGGPEWTVGR
jgi:type II secretory pathway pseudopilin PulG